MGKPSWRSKQGHDGHPPLFCPSGQMLSQSLFSSCFQGRNNSHHHSQQNKAQTSALVHRPASPFPPEENGFCVKLSQLNLKPSDVCFRFCYKPRTQAKFGGKKNKTHGQSFKQIKTDLWYEWKPYSIHYFHRGLIWNQAQSGSLKLTFASGYIESQTQHISPSTHVLARRWIHNHRYSIDPIIAQQYLHTAVYCSLTWAIDLPSRHESSHYKMSCNSNSSLSFFYLLGVSSPHFL